MRAPSLLALLALCALAPAVLCAAEARVIDLWPEGVPGLKADAGPEKDDGNGRFTNIHRPALMVYAPPPGKAHG